MSDSLPQQDFTTLKTTLWAIWYARRKIIHERILQTPFATHAFIERFLADLQCLVKSAPRLHTSVPPRPTNWIPPQEDHAKINVDATVSRTWGFGAVRAICRDGSGTFQGASSIMFRNIEDLEVLEILAIREAVALANDLYIHTISVASNCKTAVQAIRKGTSSSYGAVVLEIKQSSSTFIYCHILHEFRTLNVENHKLAKHALTLGTGRHVWFGTLETSCSSL